MGPRKRGISGISSNNWLDTSDDGECDAGSQHHPQGWDVYRDCCTLRSMLLSAARGTESIDGPTQNCCVITECGERTLHEGSLTGIYHKGQSVNVSATVG